MWRWFTAPVEVLFSDQGLVVITIILFILMVGGRSPCWTAAESW